MKTLSPKLLDPQNLPRSYLRRLRVFPTLPLRLPVVVGGALRSRLRSHLIIINMVLTGEGGCQAAAVVGWCWRVHLPDSSSSNRANKCAVLKVATTLRGSVLPPPRPDCHFNSCPPVACLTPFHLLRGQHALSPRRIHQSAPSRPWYRGITTA